MFVLLVNDGSVLEAKPEDFYFLKQVLPNFTCISYQENQGKGYALRRGIEETKHTFCIYTDVDFPYSIPSFIKLYEALVKEENDIVVGVRDENYYVQLARGRTYISKFVKLLNQIIWQLPVTDTQCGLKGFNRKGREIFLRTQINRYLFDLEFIFLAAKISRIRLGSVPVQLRPGVIFRKLDGKILITEAISLLKITFAKAIESFKKV